MSSTKRTYRAFTAFPAGRRSSTHAAGYLDTGFVRGSVNVAFNAGVNVPFSVGDSEMWNALVPKLLRLPPCVFLSLNAVTLRGSPRSSVKPAPFVCLLPNQMWSSRSSL